MRFPFFTSTFNWQQKFKDNSNLKYKNVHTYVYQLERNINVVLHAVNGNLTS